MSAAPRFFIAVVVICGTIVLTYSVLNGRSENPLKFFCYLVIALAASRLKVNLPGITGTMSVNFLFLLLGVLELSLSEAMALGCAAVVVQCLGRDRPSSDSSRLQRLLDRAGHRDYLRLVSLLPGASRRE
jgi:hypothetical protein